MASAPPWGFALGEAGRWVLGYGLRTSLAPPPRPLESARWEQLRAQAAHHRLDGLLVAAVAAGSLPVSPQQRAEVAALEVDLTRHRMVHERHLCAVVGRLATAGIATRVLKGPALAHLDYPDAQQRPTSDVDLLVRPEEIGAAADLLVAAGGRRTDPDPVPGYVATVGKGATVELEGGLEADLHRLLVWGPFGVRLDPDRLWEASRSFALVDGTTFDALDREATLLHACCHLLVLGWRRALTARDVAQLATDGRIDPDRVLWTARCAGAEALVASGLLLAHRELALDEGGPLLEWAQGFAPTWRDRLWLRVERPEAPWGVLEAAATYAELPSAAARAVLRQATFHPAPGTWSGPAQRARSAVGRARRLATGRLSG